MKSWFTKLRISAALDADRQPSAWLRRRLTRPAELCGLEQEMLALDRGLRQTAPKAEAPASLHRSIMQAVRAANCPAAAEREPSVPRWLPVPAFAVMVLLVAWWALHSPVRPPPLNVQSLAVAATALQLGHQMVRTVPPAVVAPLSDELERLNRDLDRTAQFLLASLP